MSNLYISLVETKILVQEKLQILTFLNKPANEFDFTINQSKGLFKQSFEAIS